MEARSARIYFVRPQLNLGVKRRPKHLSIFAMSTNRSHNFIAMLLASLVWLSPSSLYGQAAIVAPASTRIRVVLNDSVGQSRDHARPSLVIAQLVRSTSDSLYIKVPGASPFGVARTGIDRIELSAGSSRKRSAMKSAVLLGVIAAITVYQSSNQTYHRYEDTAVGGAIGLGVGALLGAAFPEERWRRIPL